MVCHAADLKRKSRETFPRMTLVVFSIYKAYIRETGTLVVIAVDSHNQPVVLATEETTVTQQVSHRSIKCQSRLWSQRGTKVNGSHHGDNPLFRPTGIQIATKGYATVQAMAPTSVKTVHQTSLLRAHFIPIVGVGKRGEN